MKLAGWKTLFFGDKDKLFLWFGDELWNCNLKLSSEKVMVDPLMFNVKSWRKKNPTYHNLLNKYIYISALKCVLNVFFSYFYKSDLLLLCHAMKPDNRPHTTPHPTCMLLQSYQTSHRATIKKLTRIISAEMQGFKSPLKRYNSLHKFHTSP